MAFARGLSEVQKLYSNAQMKLRSYRKVLQNITYSDPGTQEPRHLSGRATLPICLKPTALGLYWMPGMEGEDIPTYASKML
jgi:hypothetical protein